MGYVRWGLIRMYVLLYREQQLCVTKQFIGFCFFKFFISPSPTLESFDRKQLCSRELEGKEVAQFQEAIEDLYYFEFIYGEQLVCIGVCQLTSACICCAIVSLQLCCYNNNRYHI